MNKLLLNFIMFIASVAYQQRLYKKMRERMEAEAEKRKGFLIPVRGQAVSLPVVYGKQKIAGVQAKHQVIDALASVGNFTTVGYLESGIDDNTGSPKGVLPIISLRDGESNSETVYNASGVVDSSNTDQFHHAQEFNSATNTFSTSGSKNSYLLMQQAICQGGINKVKHIFVDENDYNSKDAKFDHKILVYRTGGIKDDLAVSNGIPDTNVFTDCAYSTMIFKLNRDEPNYNGIPDVQFLVEGRKIRDIIRLGSVGNYTYSISPDYIYSNNPALVLLDYLTNDKFGRGLNSSTEIDLESFYNAKIVCARDNMVYENGAATTKSIPNAGFINTVGNNTERTRSLSLDISGAFVSGNSGSVTVAMNASQINGNGIGSSSVDVGSVTGSVLTFVNPSRISFGSGKSTGGVFKNALVKAVVTGTSDGTTPLTSEAVFMPKNTDEESTGKNYSYTVESFKTVSSITFTRLDNSSVDISTENLCIGSSSNVNLPALYECNLTLDTSDTIRNNIEKILNTMGLAELTWSTEGKYKLNLAYPQNDSQQNALSVALFTKENVIRDQVNVSYNAATERFNQVTATFSNEFEDFKDDSITFPKTGSTVHNTFLNEDNNLPMSSDIDLTGITNPYHAMAKAEQIVRVSRRINTLDITLDKSALKLEPGDFITIDLVDGSDGNLGYANINGEIYRVESIAVQEDLSVKVQAYKFDHNDLAWNVPDNIAYSNREYHGFSIASPSNLKYLKNGLDAYTTSINETPATITNSSGRLTWTAPNGINRFVVDMAQVVAADYSGASDISWLGGLPWSTLGETKASFFDLPALSSIGKITYSYYGEGTEIKTWDNTNLSNFLSGSFSAGANSIKVLSPSYYKSELQMGDGTLTAGMRHNLNDLTLVEPAYIYVRANQNYTSGGGGQGNSQANRFFVSGTDIDGNVLVDHPLQRLDLSSHHASTGSPDWHKMITKPTFTVDPLTPTSPASDWSENVSGPDEMLCSTVLFQFIDNIKITPNAPTGYPIPTAATNASSGTGLTLDNFAVGLITRSVSHYYAQDPDSLRTWQDTNGITGYPDEIVPGDANMSSGVISAALTSAGPITFENPTHIILRQYDKFDSGGGLIMTQTNGASRRYFIDGIDEYGNTLIGYPLQLVDHTGIDSNEADYGTWNSKPKVLNHLIWAYGPSGDWRESERLFPNANGQDPNYDVPWQLATTGASGIPGGYTVITGVALSRFDRLYFTDFGVPTYDSGLVNGQPIGDAQPPPYAPYPSQRLDSSSSGNLGQFRVGTITKTYNKPQGDFAFSVRSISTGGFSSNRVTTLNVTDSNPNNPVLENVNENVSQVTIIYADSANQGNNNQSFTTTVNGAEATHMATVVHSDQLEPLPIRTVDRILNFVKIKGSEGTGNATVRCYFPELMLNDPSGGNHTTDFANVTLTWATGVLSGLPSHNDDTGVSRTWVQTPPSITANSTQSFWYVDMVFVNTTGATTSTPSQIFAAQRVIRFNNVVVFSGTNTSQTTLEELKIQLGGVGNTIIDGGLINSNSITANEINANAITVNSLDVKKINGQAASNLGISHDMFQPGALGDLGSIVKTGASSVFFGSQTSSSVGVGIIPVIAIRMSYQLLGSSYSTIGGDGSSFTFTFQGSSYNTSGVAAFNQSKAIAGGSSQYGGTYTGATSVTLTNSNFKLNSINTPIVTIALRSCRLIYHNGTSPFPNFNNLGTLYGALAIKLNNTIVASCSTDLVSKGTIAGSNGPSDILLTLPGSSFNSGTNTLKCFLYGRGRGTGTTSVVHCDFYCDVVEFISLNS